jgi:hypothetical protein
VAHIGGLTVKKIIGEKEKDCNVIVIEVVCSISSTTRV